jgi:hypothetical protein
MEWGKDIKTMMICVSLGKSHIREQVERLNGINVPPPTFVKGKLFDIRRSHPVALRSVTSRQFGCQNPRRLRIRRTDYDEGRRHDLAHEYL